MNSFVVFAACFVAFASAACPPKGLPISLSIPLPAAPPTGLYRDEVCAPAIPLPPATVIHKDITKFKAYPGYAGYPGFGAGYSGFGAGYGAGFGTGYAGFSSYPGYSGYGYSSGAYPVAPAFPAYPAAPILPGYPAKQVAEKVEKTVVRPAGPAAGPWY